MSTLNFNVPMGGNAPAPAVQAPAIQGITLPEMTWKDHKGEIHKICPVLETVSAPPSIQDVLTHNVNNVAGIECELTAFPETVTTGKGSNRVTRATGRAKPALRITIKRKDGRPAEKFLGGMVVDLEDFMLLCVPGFMAAIQAQVQQFETLAAGSATRAIWDGLKAVSVRTYQAKERSTRRVVFEGAKASTDLSNLGASKRK